MKCFRKYLYSFMNTDIFLLVQSLLVFKWSFYPILFWNWDNQVMPSIYKTMQNRCPLLDTSLVQVFTELCIEMQKNFWLFLFYERTCYKMLIFFVLLPNLFLFFMLLIDMHQKLLYLWLYGAPCTMLPLFCCIKLLPIRHVVVIGCWELQ